MSSHKRNRSNTNYAYPLDASPRPRVPTDTLHTAPVSLAAADARSVASSAPVRTARWLIPTLIVAAILFLSAGLLRAQTDAATGIPTVARTLITVPARITPAALLFALVLVLALTFLNAFLALAEIALITVRRTRIRQLVEEGNGSAIKVEQLLSHPTRLMATIQTGITLIGTFASTIAATTAVEPFALWLRMEGMGTRASETLALFSVTIPVAVLTLVIGEIAPKSIAVRHPERLALIAVYPVQWLQILLTPVVVILTFLSNVVVRPFGGTAHFTTPAVNEEELKILVEAGEEQGVLQPEATEMIHSILDLSDTVVRKVMTPRIDLSAIDVAAPLEELVQLVQTSGHSRIPAYEGDLDNIVGIVHAKDLLALPAFPGRENTPIRDVVRPPYFIPETKKVDQLLKEFKRSKQQLAIVRDEYGVTSGLVTIEDLVEEIVGDIQDEYDMEESRVQVIDSYNTILDGRLGLSETNDRMGLELPEDEADTIGGFVFGLLGHQAVQGERAVWQRIEFVVEATDGRRITKVRLIKPYAPLPPDDGEPSNEQASDAGDGSRPRTYARDEEQIQPASHSLFRG